ncbi:ATP-dependent helicase [Halalkalibacter krulwichiae]|uniref:DNA 3'-5' helicase n=1 Tax=Halalkalibacter krulwichiae TaxID=199441 RepID=A0A1X9MIF4_9BACI|nr:ATP-dependent helicase [Halalkalibacter krulwichiae]ARK31441.1 Putative ATP-dependent DNA helicase YjcD [Halalkalibacter krulwichiae]
MHVAYYKNKVIYLPNCERSSWQQLYMASIKQELTCIHCHTPLKMELGILKPPSFTHVQATNECIEAASLMTKKFTQHHINLNEKQNVHSDSGFSIPKRRSISSSVEQNEIENWKEPEQVRAIPNFNEKKATTGHLALNPYREKLQKSGIYLDNQQWEAVQTTEGPLLILAGAGSGKTRVLTTRTAYMLSELNYSPKELILVTFTAKAAKEMKERMRLYPGLNRQTLNQLVIGTFHSIFYKMLMHHDPQRWSPSNLLKQDWLRQAMIKEAGRELNLDEKEFAFDQALTQISWWKNHLMAPEKIKGKDLFEERVVYLYKRYEEMRKAQNAFDFDDMLLGLYELLHENDRLLKRYQQRFSYVSVDEFQDINKVQVELITMLSDRTKNLCVVGDDDQSIYAFRGSEPSYILNFKERYHNTKMVILSENYRSSHEIVSSANNVIHTNRQRYQKQLHAQTSTHSPPLLFYPFDEEEEATMIVTDIKKQIETGANPEDFAILFRTNTAARALIERFISSSIPFQLDADGDSFYQRKAVRKILAYLQLGINPDDGHALTDLIGALFLKQETVQEIKAASITNNCTFVEALPLIKGLKPFQTKKLQTLPTKFKQLKEKSPIDAIAFIEQEMGFSEYVKKNGNEGNKMERGSDDVRDLKVVARQHDTIEDFLRHINHMTIKFDELRNQKANPNSVQLMTIHRAKGLEFKHVYILSTVEGGLPHDYALEAWRDGDDKPLEEERRLMYVAITRAEDSLKISIPLMRRGKKAFRSRFAREIQRIAPEQAHKSRERNVANGQGIHD